MEKYNLPQDIITFGIQVKTFPFGVSDAFNKLSKELKDDGLKRPYYGISWIDEKGNIVYYANAVEIFPDEAQKYSHETYIIEKGEYFSVKVSDWHSKTDCLKDIFHDMMQDEKTDNTKPCIEWYKSNDEMLCMMKGK